ncbi:hypothetical protein STIAU_1256, partial [Stigmatella aurantiaca DW4/3-1]
PASPTRRQALAQHLIHERGCLRLVGFALHVQRGGLESLGVGHHPVDVLSQGQPLHAEGDVLHSLHNLDGSALEDTPVAHDNHHDFLSFRCRRQQPDSMMGRPASRSVGNRYASTRLAPSRAMVVRW